MATISGQVMPWHRVRVSCCCALPPYQLQMPGPAEQVRLAITEWSHRLALNPVILILLQAKLAEDLRKAEEAEIAKQAALAEKRK